MENTIIIQNISSYKLTVDGDVLNLTPMVNSLKIENISSYVLKIQDNNLHIIPDNSYIDEEKNNIENNKYINLPENDFMESFKPHTKIDFCKIIDTNKNIISVSETYTTILFDIFKTMNIKNITKITKFNYSLKNETGKKGFSYIHEIGLSFQRKDAYNTLLEIIKMVKYNKYKLVLKVKTKTEKLYQLRI